MADGAERNSGNGPDTPRRPNFVVILAHDLGFSDIGCHGSEIAFRLFKHWVHEGGIATPLVASWPRLVSRHPGAWELYDRHRDRTELHDLAAARGDEVARLSRRYDDWARRCGVLPWHELQQRGAQ